MRSGKAILASSLLLLIVISVPAVASAITAAVSVDGQPCGSLVITVDDVTNTLTISGPGATLPATCGDITFDSNAVGSFPQVAALSGGSTDQLVLSNAVITNNSFTDAHTVTITYSHFFPGINETVDRFYGMSASGSFFRPPFDLASGDSLTMRSSVTYTQNGKPVTVPIGTTCCTTGTDLTYTVPSLGSVGLNDYTPQKPPQIIEKINCSTNLSGPPCDPGETIATTASTTLAAGDTNSLVGSTHNAACADVNFCAQLLSALQASIDVHPGGNNLVGPGDSGMLILDLLGALSAQVCSSVVDKHGRTTTTCVTVPPFHVNDVNLLTVVFGPACPAAYNPQNPANGGTGCKATVQHASFMDVNGDGILDVRLSFSNPDIHWNTKCQPLQKTGTLVGFLNNGQLFVATGSVQCQPPKL